jgi:putrescine transport system permease protein
MKQRSAFVFSMMAFGYAFLYLPILSVILYSFNASRLVTVWGGFSTQWYGALFRNTAVLQATARSLLIAAMAASLAVAIGTLAAVALSRFQRMRGRPLLSLMTSAPLVMPEVMLGLSALLLFVGLQQWFGWPAGRGMMTITIAHATFCSAYVTVIAQSRLAQVDESLEEAALDLGARPSKVFFLVTLPVIFPALAAGWLLAFTLSLDDLVVASFVSGPSSTTLPMLIYSKVKFGITPEINALATLFVATVTLLIVAAALVGRRRRRQAIP